MIEIKLFLISFFISVLISSLGSCTSLVKTGLITKSNRFIPLGSVTNRASFNASLILFPPSLAETKKVFKEIFSESKSLSIPINFLMTMARSCTLLFTFAGNLEIKLSISKFSIISSCLVVVIVDKFNVEISTNCFMDVFKISIKTKSFSIFTFSSPVLVTTRFGAVTGSKFCIIFAKASDCSPFFLFSKSKVVNGVIWVSSEEPTISKLNTLSLVSTFPLLFESMVAPLATLMVHAVPTGNFSKMMFPFAPTSNKLKYFLLFSHSASTGFSSFIMYPSTIFLLRANSFASSTVNSTLSLVS